MAPGVRGDLVTHAVRILDTIGLIVVIYAIPWIQINMVYSAIKIRERERQAYSCCRLSPRQRKEG
jgi:hypothetical protein